MACGPGTHVVRPSSWPRLLALVVAVYALVVPVGAMITRSFLVEEVELADGEVLVAVGRVEQQNGLVRFATQSAPGAERVPERFRDEDVREVRHKLSLHHHRFVLSDPRLTTMLLGSVGIAFGGATLALLLGLPLAWLVGRTDLKGRMLLAALSTLPALLPPFFVALGAARDWQGAVIAIFGFEGAALQRATSVLVFGLVLFPLVMWLGGLALARVPKGPYEAALLLGGRSAARRHVVGPLLRPTLAGAWLLAFVLALSDFAVPDLLGFLLPTGGVPTSTFATEILLQWKQEGNAGRAVATGGPLVLVTLLLVVVASRWIRRSPAFATHAVEDALPRMRLSTRSRVLAYLGWGIVLFVAVGLPVLGVAGWAGDGGESVVRGSGATAEVVRVASSGRLGDIAGAMARTAGSEEELHRWLTNAGSAALLAMLLAVPLVHAALRRGRFWRVAVPSLGLVGLATPGLALSVGSRVVHDALPVPILTDAAVPPVLALMARFLPVALLMAWLALRSIRRGEEEAGRLAGAGAWTRTATLVLKPALGGLVAGVLLTFVLALREIEAVMVLDARILPMRLYDKIHFSRLADEANLLLLCVLVQLAPAVLLAALLGLRRAFRGQEVPVA
ncbi:MAG: ABC transporter permease [Planctomycetota bacterium]